MKLWIVGQVKGGVDELGVAWEFQGVFSTKEMAVAACSGREDWFVGPAVLDEALPVGKSEWPGLYYPWLEAAVADALACEEAAE